MFCFPDLVSSVSLRDAIFTHLMSPLVLAIAGKLRQHEAGVIVSGAIQDTIIVPFGEVNCF